MVYQDILTGLQKAKKRRSKSLDDIDLSEISEKVLDRKAWARSAQKTMTSEIVTREPFIRKGAS